MNPETRVAGWRKVERVELQGEPALVDRLREVLETTGREDRLTHGFHTYPAGLHPDAARTLWHRVGDVAAFVRGRHDRPGEWVFAVQLDTAGEAKHLVGRDAVAGDAGGDVQHVFKAPPEFRVAVVGWPKEHGVQPG